MARQKKNLSSQASKNVTSNSFSLPEDCYPQLATLVKKAPSGDNWLHETKYDGYRIIAHMGKKIRLLTRDLNDWTHKFTWLQADLEKMHLENTILDGEVVAFDDNGKVNFQLLQNTLHHDARANLHYYVFDLLFYQGEDLRMLPLLARKKLLKKILPKRKKSSVHFCEHLLGHGEWIFAQACQAQEEGIISKDIHSPYLSKRTRYWQKVKCTNRQEFIVCGFTLGKGKRTQLGSLVLGYYSADKALHYCGHVGTGFNDKTLAEIYQLLKDNQTEKMPFSVKPKQIGAVFWVKPIVVIEVEFREWTSEGILRHASFKGLRLDKPADQVFKES